MAHVISEIELTGGDRAALMGGDPNRKDTIEAQRLHVRLVFVRWVDRFQKIPLVVAECSEHSDALGKPIWQPAEKLPLALVMAALGGQVSLRATTQTDQP